MTASLVGARPVMSRIALVVGTVLAGVVVAGAVTLQGARSGRDLFLFLVGLGLAGIGLASARLSIIVTVATFMFWALLRRLLPAVNAAVDPAAIVPFFVALPLAARGMRMRKPTPYVLLLVWISISAGLSFAQPLVGIAGWFNFALPLLAAIGIRGIPSGVQILARSTVICGSLAATYGIVQYFLPLGWDLKWLERSNFVSVGAFGESTFRPFATLPGPGTAAVMSAIVILLLLFRRDTFDLASHARVWALVVSILFLLLTQVRSAWVAFIIALVIGFVTVRRQSLLRIALCITVAVAALAVAPQGETVSRRAETLGNLGTDASFQSRLNFVRGATQLISPLGSGVGTRSSGSRVGSDQSIDNGYLVVLAEVGVVGFGLLIWVLASMVSRSRSRDYPFLVFLIVINLAGFGFGGLAGLLLWVLSDGTLRSPDRAPPAPALASPVPG